MTQIHQINKNMAKDIVRRYIEEVVNTGNIERISDFISFDYAEEYYGKRYQVGIQGAIDHINGVRKTYADLKLTITLQVCEDEWVATYYFMTGVHVGEWMGIRPTHKKITVTGINLDKVVNGKIVEHTGAANLFEPLLEIGAIELV